jgi:hypothetical protein
VLIGMRRIEVEELAQRELDLAGAARRHRVHAGAGGYTVLGVVIAIVAVGVGVALAKAIGRQGKV